MVKKPVCDFPFLSLSLSFFFFSPPLLSPPTLEERLALEDSSSGSSLAWILTAGSLLLYGFITIDFCSKFKVWAQCQSHTDFLALPGLTSELFTCMSTTTIPAGLGVGSLTSAKGCVCAAGCRGFWRYNLKWEGWTSTHRAPCCYGGTASFQLLCSADVHSLFCTVIQTAACGGIERQPQIHMS